MILTYLFALLLSIGGLAVLDWRYRLAFWHDARRSGVTLLYGILIFVVWDILGIALGIFKHGNSPLALPFTLLPEFPVEEIFFLGLLCYCTLLLFRGAQRLCSRT
ncbi:lycopene cyclase domain-containing protein [Candidatus Saccharibacteria bacterium]|nr:MAG: lycopene cyclase domain-containing protein [Candidatus Saccharibacteria bacterium]